MPNFEVYEILTRKDLFKSIGLWNKSKRPGLYFDTETTGLHIINDQPFLIQWGFYNTNLLRLEIFIIDKRDVGATLFKEAALALLIMAKKSPFLIGHNIKYDLHMLSNLGLKLSDSVKYGDTMIFIRAAHDALTVANGGPPMQLKEYAQRYITRRAKEHEQELALERTAIAKAYNLDLKNKLGWTIKAIDDFFKDVLNDSSVMTPKDRKAYSEWLKTIPKEIQNKMDSGRVESSNIPYTMLNVKNIKKYAALDIVWTYAVHQQCLTAIKARGTELTVELEEKLIPALVRMERCGFQINKEYVLEVRTNLKEYISQRRKDMYKLAGQELSVGQHALIKKILLERFELDVKGTGAGDLQDVIADISRDESKQDALDFIKTVQEMRTLEKWYSTYLQRFYREMQHSDRIYTQINQVGTVAGRVTSDFQQFPRGGIEKNDGTPLFNPRAMVSVTPGFKGIAYLDYSQVELRGQAMYTILVDSPDTNLIRAFMPFRCYTLSVNKLPIPFDYNNEKHLEHIHSRKWYHGEDGTEWHPIDVHAATAQQIIPGLTKDHPEYNKWRSIGKTTNFAKNYGAKFNRIRTMFPDFDDETIHKIDEAYYQAFPGVKGYHKYCYDIVMESAYVSNLFGVKYYGMNGHKLINALVQGSCAYFLKDRIYEVDKYIQAQGLKTKMQMQIHDELSYEVWPGEEHHILEIQKIMSKWSGMLIPIKADLEFTKTNWAEKEEVNEII